MGSTPSSRRRKKRASTSRPQFSARQEVAAVCYRVSSRGLEFLLVQTRGGRWIFPKGGVEPGLTHAQSAALEAFEEAGVHGRIEEVSFARYHRHKSNSTPQKRDTLRDAYPAVIAHLCEVSHLEQPQESNRRPTWFSPELAKKRLVADRNSTFGGELASVVDRAVSRIRRLQAAFSPTRKKDALQTVRFDAFENSRLLNGRNHATLMRSFLLERQGLGIGANLGAEKQIAFRKVLQLGTGARTAEAPLQSVHVVGPDEMKTPRNSRRSART